MKKESLMKIEKILNLVSGRICLVRTEDGYLVEATEMQDVTVDGKLHAEVRETQDPHIIWKHLVPHKDKWLLTVSTQKGCTFNCRFCDVAGLPFKGNLTLNQILEQIDLLLMISPTIKESNKVKIGFARMGEPACNLDNVLEAIRLLPQRSMLQGRTFNWLPCFNSIVPKNIDDCIERVIETKEKHYNGFLHFQISCNSTNEDTRKSLFGGATVLPLEEVIARINKQKVTNRTVTLNFIVMEGVEVSVDKLRAMNLNKDKFSVKLIPLNATLRAGEHDLKTYANYSNYEKLLELKETFEKRGIPVVVDAIAKCEEAGLCCGQLAQIFSK